MMLRALALALALLLFPHAAEAVSIDLRTTDKLELGAPSVSAFPTGTSTVVAAADYREIGAGATIDFAIIDGSGNRTASYQEPVWAAGSGTALVRLIANGPLQPGAYRLRASTPGANPAEVPFTVGAAGAGPGAQPTAAPGPTTPPGSGKAPPPAQLPSPAQLPVLSARKLATIDSGRRFGLANVLPDGWSVPGAPASGTVAWIARALDAGAAGNRWELRWDQVELAPGVYDWSAIDRVVSANEVAGMPLLLILIGTPPWAGAAAGAPPNGLEAASILPDGSLSPANPWGRFVHTVAARYRGRVLAYEVWNEPNRSDFWSGSPAEYYRLLATAMAAVRHADPGAKVVFGGLDGYRDPTFLDGVLDAALADPAPPGRRGAFDVLGWHVYHRPLDVYVGTLELRERLRARGLHQPVWITETNVAAWDDRQVRGESPRPYRWSATSEEQSAFLLEAFAYAMAADVERIFLYRASDAGEGEAWGLQQVDGKARPVERAFRFATELLIGANRARRLGGEGIERIVVDRPGARVTIAWATGPADAPLVFDAVTSGPAQLRDKIGGIGSVTPIGGRFILSLPGASANQGIHPGDYVIGGDPYVIVEQLS